MASRLYVKADRAFDDLLAELRRVDREMEGRVAQAIVRGSDPILAQARRNAPYDPTHRGHRHAHAQGSDPGHIRDSLGLRAAPYGAALYTTHPGAPVHHWGGSIAPRGTPIYFERSEFATRAGEQKADRVAEAVDREIDRLLSDL